MFQKASGYKVCLLNSKSIYNTCISKSQHLKCDYSNFKGFYSLDNDFTAVIMTQTKHQMSCLDYANLIMKPCIV